MTSIPPTAPAATPSVPPTATTLATVPSAVAMSPRWASVIGAFAVAIGSTLEAVTAKLTENFVDGATDDSLVALADPGSMTDADWSAAFPGAKRVSFNRAVATLRAAVAPTPAPVAPVAPTAPPSYLMGDALETPPTGESFLNVLRTGGRLNGMVTPTDVMSACAVALADAAGLYRVPDRLAALMAQTAENREVPADAAYYELERMLNERAYADVLKAIGAPGRTVTDASRNAFRAKVATEFWPGLRAFANALKSWFEMNRVAMSDPSMLLAAISGMAGGMAGGMMPPPQVVDTQVLRDAARSLAQMANKLFSGPTAVPTARAMAAEAVQIGGFLSDPRFVTAAGFQTQDEMIRGLGLGVSDLLVRQEASVRKFVLNAFSLPDADEATLRRRAYELYALLQNIDFDALIAPSSNPAPRRKNPNDRPEFRPFSGDPRSGL